MHVFEAMGTPPPSQKVRKHEHEERLGTHDTTCIVSSSLEEMPFDDLPQALALGEQSVHLWIHNERIGSYPSVALLPVRLAIEE